MIAETEVAEVAEVEAIEVEQVAEAETESTDTDETTEQEPAAETTEQTPEVSVDEVVLDVPPQSPEDVAKMERISRMISADHDYIDHVRDLRRSVAVAETLLEDAKSLVKDRKETYERKVKQLLEVIDAGPERGLPLFSSANTDNREASESFASVNGDGSSAASADATASTPDSADPVPAEDNSWKSVTLDELGFTGKLHESLTEAGLTTMGAIADWSSSGKLLTDVPGVGEAKAAKIEEATARYWAEHPRVVAEEALGDIVRDVLENPPTEEEHFKAIYDAGRKACKEGVPSMQNPCVEAENREAWNNGWNDEFAEQGESEDFSDI